MAKNIRVFYIDKHGNGSERIIKNDLETEQNLVGGWIEEINIAGVPLIINEEGRINELERTFAYEVMENYWDCVYGPSFFVNVNYETGEYISLTDSQMARAMKIYTLGRYVLAQIELMESEKLG